MKALHVCIGKEVTDFRTRDGRELEVIRQVQRYGGFSIFWVTDNQKRAWAATRLENTGVIVRVRDDPRDAYPWCVVVCMGEAARVQKGTP